MHEPLRSTPLEDAGATAWQTPQSGSISAKSVRRLPSRAAVIQCVAAFVAAASWLSLGISPLVADDDISWRPAFLSQAVDLIS